MPAPTSMRLKCSVAADPIQDSAEAMDATIESSATNRPNSIKTRIGAHSLN